MSSWFAIEIPMGEQRMDDLPDRTHSISPEKTPTGDTSEEANKENKTASKALRPRAVEPAKKPPVSVSAQAARTQKEDVQPASSQPTPSQLPSDWPEAPAPGTFSR